MLGAMDAAQAIGDLKEISPQVRDVVVIAPDGATAGSSLADEPAAARLADGAKRLLEAAEELRAGGAQLEAAPTGGSVFVVRDGERLIAATTTPEPTVGLVFYDLKTCLRSVTEPEAKEEAKPRRARAKKTDEEDGNGTA